MQAFIIRPFNTRDEIDFENVHKKLIAPALEAAEITGDTTESIFSAGNIRDDMFQLLLLADLVIADISIHNANVFYELGIRHALRGRQTFLIRAKVSKPRPQRLAEDEVPFDLKTDRYLEYDHTNPEAALDALIRGLKETRNSIGIDSPVFRSLPKLSEPERSQLTPVPLYFYDDVQYASDHKQWGKLGLLGWEARQCLWEIGALRLVGRELFSSGAWECAREAWEAVRENEPRDFEANRLLGTIYQRLGDISKSEICLARALANEKASLEQKAEALALRGSNEKAKARQAYAALEGKSLAEDVLKTGALSVALNYYRRGFELALNHYYSGLNALSLCTLLLKLIDQNQDTWSATYSTSDEAEAARTRIIAEQAELGASVSMALKAAEARLQPGETDEWLALSRADFAFLTAERDSFVATQYRRALAKLAPMNVSAARSQLELFAHFGVFPQRVQACLSEFPAVEAVQAWNHAIIFSGHMIDAPGRSEPRFPASAEGAARRAILLAVQRLAAATPGSTIGVAGGASGGDILFHEVCAELGIQSILRLTLPPGKFIAASVAPAGPDWVKRFHALIERLGPEKIQVLDNTEELPRWMKYRTDYNVWQRTNIWILQEAIATAPNRSLIALWDGKPGDGPGGTQHLIDIAPSFGVAVGALIDTTTLVPGERTGFTLETGLE